MKSLRSLLRDRQGLGAVEFALIAPVIFAFIIAISQVGMLFYANAGLNNALADGARFAIIFPRPTNEQISARITDRRFGLDPAFITGPTYSTPVTSNGITHMDITLSYAAPMDFIFFRASPVTLSETRRVYLQPQT
jgi:Flp pilus assembly protein TadG